MGCGSSVPVANAKQEKLISSLEKTVKELKKRVAVLEAESSNPGAAVSASLGLAKGQALASVATCSSVPSALHTEPEPSCICDAGAGERAEFLSEKWIPFLQDLHREYLAAATRFVADYNPEQIFPAQTRVEELAERCAELTREWHGKRNYSTVYEWLVELHELDRHTYPYRFEELPAEHSEDGWVRIIDATMRRNKIVLLQQSDIPATLPQDAGDSPIDNTVLSNVVSAEEGHLLLAGGHIKGMFLRTLAAKQTTLLRKFSDFFAENPIGMEHDSWLNLLQAPPQDVVDAIEHAEWRPDVDLTAMGVSEESVSWQFLKRNGHVVESFNQLSKAEQKQVHQFLAAEFHLTADESAAMEEAQEPRTELDQFVAWAKVHPGQWWKASKQEHQKLLVAALLSPKFAVLKRSAVERLTHHRFFLIPWTRQVPLITVDEDGSERVVREAMAKEHSRIRKNKFPYTDSHGLALSSGGLVERADLDKEHGGSGPNLMFELGMPVEPHARLGNLWLCDVEKLLHETALLNACKPHRDRLLPCEVCHEAGQNPAASSSVGNTQHMQLGRSSVQDWPLMQLHAKPMWCAELGASLDLVQVGDLVDAFMLRFRTVTPVNIPLIAAIQDVRLAIMREFGGHQVDFNVMAMPDSEEGDFVVTVTPIAAIKDDERGVYNGVTEQRVEDTQLPREGFCKIDSSQGKGNALLYSTEDWARVRGSASGGRKLLEALYDYNAVPGMRRFLRSFLLKRYGYIDNVYGKAKGPGAVHHDKTTKTPIFSTQLQHAPHHQPLLEQYMASTEASEAEAGEGLVRPGAPGPGAAMQLEGPGPGSWERAPDSADSSWTVSVKGSEDEFGAGGRESAHRGKIAPFPSEVQVGPLAASATGPGPGTGAGAGKHQHRQGASATASAGGGGLKGRSQASRGAGGQALQPTRAPAHQSRCSDSTSTAPARRPVPRVPRPPSLSSSSAKPQAAASKAGVRSEEPGMKRQESRVKSQATGVKSQASETKSHGPETKSREVGPKSQESERKSQEADACSEELAPSSAVVPLPEYSGVLRDLLADDEGEDEDQFRAEVESDRAHLDPNWPSYPNYPDTDSRPLTEADSQPRSASAQSRNPDAPRSAAEADPPSSPSVVRRWGGPRVGLGTGFGSFDGHGNSPRGRDNGERAAALMAALPRPPDSP